MRTFNQWLAEYELRKLLAPEEPEPESTEPLFELQEAAPQEPEDIHIFSDTLYGGGEFTVEMAGKSNKAKPAIRSPVVLPS